MRFLWNVLDSRSLAEKMKICFFVHCTINLNVYQKGIIEVSKTGKWFLKYFSFFFLKLVNYKFILKWEDERVANPFIKFSPQNMHFTKTCKNTTFKDQQILYIMVFTLVDAIRIDLLQDSAEMIPYRLCDFYLLQLLKTREPHTVSKHWKIFILMI